MKDKYILLAIRNLAIVLLLIVVYIIADRYFANRRYKKKEEYWADEYYKQTALAYDVVRLNPPIKAEYKAYKALAEYLKAKGENYKFRFLINPLFILGDVYSEADLILLCPAGIIVYEIKNYQDTVIASNNKYWEHHIGNQTFKFYSPYQQNETHIRILKEYIRTKTCNVSFGNRLNYIVHNIVVFASETERRSHMTNIKFDKSCSDNVKNAIFNLQNIKKTVELFGDGALSDKEIDELYKQLFHTTVYIPEQREKQIEYAKQQGYDD